MSPSGFSIAIHCSTNVLKVICFFFPEIMLEPVVSWSLLEFPDCTGVIVELDLLEIYDLDPKVDAACPDAEFSANILGGDSGL